ncbi:MAG: J domain-containing protein [Caulobacteraceae bacterium]
MLPALLVLALIFSLLFFTRVGGAYRVMLMRRWPILLLAGAAFLALVRGAIWPAIALLGFSILAWMAWPKIEELLRPAAPMQPRDSPEDSAARAVLGIGPNATADEIRRAYRAKMARAHPDRGGSHTEAARLTAARDRLLKKKR